MLIGLVCFVDLFFFIWKNNLVYGVGFVVILSYIYVGFEVFFNKFRFVCYFIFVWSMFVIGVIIGMLSFIGILFFNDFIMYCF